MSDSPSSPPTPPADSDTPHGPEDWFFGWVFEDDDPEWPLEFRRPLEPTEEFGLHRRCGLLDVQLPPYLLGRKLATRTWEVFVCSAQGQRIYAIDDKHLPQPWRGPAQAFVRELREHLGMVVLLADTDRALCQDTLAYE